MPIDSSSYLQQASIFSDLNSLDSIRREGLKDELGAIKKAAKEFEAFFLKMMLKSMRQASEVIGEDNMMSSQQEKMFTGMMDDQLAVDLSQKGSLGIADLMISQISQKLNLDTSVDKANAPEPLKRELFFNPAISQKSLDASPSVRESSNTISAANFEFSKSEPEQKEKLNSDAISLGMEKLNISQSKPDKVEPTKKALFKSASEFVEKLLPIARETAKKLNLDPKVLVAQAALETGWGKFIMHDESGKPGFNLFGIKASGDWKGDAIEIGTLEVENSIVKKVKAEFRKYQSFAESFQDYANFLMDNSRYQKAVSATEKPDEFVKQLQSAGYATDPHYASKIMRIFSDDVLQKVDGGE